MNKNNNQIELMKCVYKTSSLFKKLSMPKTDKELNNLRCMQRIVLLELLLSNKLITIRQHNKLRNRVYNMVELD